MEKMNNNLSHVKFAKDDVLTEKNKIKVRRSTLQKASLLGTLYKRKVRISYMSIEGQVSEVFATVWAVGEQFVSLTGAQNIPIHAIVKVDF